MVAKGGAGEEFMQTVSEVRPVGRCDKPPSAQETTFHNDMGCRDDILIYALKCLGKTELGYRGS